MLLNFIWISSTIPKFRKKTNDPIERKCFDRGNGRQKDWWKDGQTLFYKTLLAIARGPRKL